MPTQTRKSSTKQGFVIPSPTELEQERNLATFNTSDKETVHSNDKKPFNYYVIEKTRFRVKDNTSIQLVGFGLREENNARAVLGTINAQDGTAIVLAGNADGSVKVSKSMDSFSVSPSILPGIDITEAAAKAGITAAGIRRTQKDIAGDGEIERPEQEQIIKLLSKAKELAGLK